ncbi:MAG: putative hydrolase of the HAD superfamily [Halocynthiibacter sp.]|jgi:putative hydrolase of the HAD superfamily
MQQMITTIGFDADDTLWQNEHLFRMTQQRFAELLVDFTEADHLAERLLAAERRNLGHYGFGIKGFVLSMIETAIEVTDQKVPASVIADLIAAGQDMLHHPIELMPHALDAVEALAQTHKIVLITKGDLLDQERKLAQSGLGELFHGIEIVSDKKPPVYADIFARHGTGPEAAMMVGNSMKSDVIPPIEAGGWGVYIPHGLTWELEHAAAPQDHPRFHELEDLGKLAALIEAIEKK